jgi:hypothetical protein
MSNLAALFCEQIWRRNSFIERFGWYTGSSGFESYTRKRHLDWGFLYFLHLSRPNAGIVRWWFLCLWGENMSLNCDHQRACCSSPKWFMIIESHCGMIMTGENRRTRRKTCTSATLSTTNLTWTEPVANPFLCGERPAAYCLSHGTTGIVP